MTLNSKLSGLKQMLSQAKPLSAEQFKKNAPEETRWNNSSNAIHYIKARVPVFRAKENKELERKVRFIPLLNEEYVLCKRFWWHKEIKGEHNVFCRTLFGDCPYCAQAKLLFDAGLKERAKPWWNKASNLSVLVDRLDEGKGAQFFNMSDSAHKAIQVAAMDEGASIPITAFEDGYDLTFYKRKKTEEAEMAEFLDWKAARKPSNLCSNPEQEAAIEKFLLEYFPLITENEDGEFESNVFNILSVEKMREIAGLDEVVEGAEQEGDGKEEKEQRVADSPKSEAKEDAKEEPAKASADSVKDEKTKDKDDEKREERVSDFRLKLKKHNQQQPD